LTALLAPGLWAQSVLTWHNDTARTGQNLEETLLSPTNVSSANFGLKFTLSVDGQVDAQPLYVPALSIDGNKHNVLYVVTENDSIYAFDADAGGASLWPSHSILQNGETVSDSDNGCGQIGSEVGITSTPAIDMSFGPNGTIFFVAMTKNGSTYIHRLHAFDLVLGTEESGWPITISAPTFVPKQYKERAGLLISNGVVYTAWASNCDDGAYNGWIIGYNESTRAQVMLNLTPNGQKGAIWQSGAGPAADAGGDLYFLMANGYFDGTLNAAGFPADGDYGNAFMNLATTSGLSVADYFTSDNSPVETGTQNDDDLGSGGPLLLPTLNDAMGNPHALAVGAGKDGIAYVVDRNNMGKYHGSSNAVYQQFSLGGAVFSSPAWFNNTLYYNASGQPLAAYPYSGGSFGSATQSSPSFGNGATPSISALGSSNGIVWAVNTGSPAVLYAFNASNMSELYNSTQAGGRDTFGTGIHFTTPTVANGKVYVGTTAGVGVFGPLNCAYGPSAFGTLSVDATAHVGGVTVTATPSSCSWSATATSEFISITGGASGSGNGTVLYSIPANPGLQRVGTIIAAGNIVTVTQAGSDSLLPPSNPAPANGSVGVPVSPILSWTGSGAATSYDVYFGTSSTPSFVTNIASTSYTPATLVPGITYYWMVVAKNSSGSSSSPVWSFTMTDATTISVVPNSGSGANHSFVLQYSDTAGTGSLTWVWAWFGTSLSNSANSCVIYYQISTNQVNLLNDAGSAWTVATPGAATTLHNSQCSLNVATTSVGLSGNTLTLTLPMTFQPSFGGAKNIYMYAGDISGTNTGWQQRGTWTVPSSAGVAAAVSVMPNAGSTASQSFAFLYSDTAGAASLGSVWLWFNPSLTVSPNSCEVYYLPSTNQVGLLNDAGSAWTTGTVGAGTLQNSQCSLNLAATSVNSSGENLTLNLPMTFLAGFAGAKNIYMYAADVSGSNTGWVQRGSWTAPGTTPTPAAVTVTPSSGSAASQSFTFQYSDSGGSGRLSWVWAWFSTTLGSSANSCVLYYQPSINQVNLLNDAGTAWTAATPGAATTLQNSQCSLNVASTSATPSGNNLALVLAMTFKPAFNGTQNTYMYAGDTSGSNTGWIQRGTWDVPGSGGTPSAVSVTPNSGSGVSQTFALQYSDTGGTGSLSWVWAWFGASVGSGANACVAYYQPSTNQVNLLNDAGTAWSAGTVGTGATLQNSQCSLDMATTSVTQSGNTLTLNLGTTFEQAFAGTQNVFMYAGDVEGSNTGWVQRGTWTVPGAGGTPAAISVTPSSGSTASQNFTLQYSDTGGTGSLSWVWVWFSATSGSSASSCVLYYQPSTNQVNLLNDAGNSWTAATPGAVTTLQNSQCSVNLASTSVTPSGDNLTLNLPMTFQPAYAGAKNIDMYAADTSGSNTGWIQRGTWTVP
jgi:hypothetical protein